MTALKNLKEFHDYIAELAEEWDDEEDVYAFCHRQADNSEHVIYYSGAWDLVNMIRVANRRLLDEAEEEIDNDAAIDEVMTRLAYQLIYQTLVETLE